MPIRGLTFHGIDQRHIGRHQLRHIFITGTDRDLDLCSVAKRTSVPMTSGRRQRIEITVSTGDTTIADADQYTMKGGTTDQQVINRFWRTAQLIIDYLALIGIQRQHPELGIS